MIQINQSQQTETVNLRLLQQAISNEGWTIWFPTKGFNQLLTFPTHVDQDCNSGPLGSQPNKDFLPASKTRLKWRTNVSTTSNAVEEWRPDSQPEGDVGNTSRKTVSVTLQRPGLDSTDLWNIDLCGSRHQKFSSFLV